MPQEVKGSERKVIVILTEVVHSPVRADSCTAEGVDIVSRRLCRGGVCYS